MPPTTKPNAFPDCPTKRRIELPDADTARPNRGGLFRSFLKFAVTGAAGFGVDAATLSLLLMTTDLGPFYSRAVSFPVALCVTWYLNRIWTFERSDQDRLPQSARYVFVQFIGAAFNFAIFALCIGFGPPLVARYPVIALGAASGTAMILNFLGSRYWAFAGKSRVSVVGTFGATRGAK